MKRKNTKTPNGRSATMLILLCWLVYTCSYIGKVNYAANINPVMSYYGISHAEAGLVSTLFFFAYGIGQVVNGLFCKKYNLKWVIFFSLTVSGVANLIVPFLPSFEPIKYLWVLNGFSLSILWPGLIRLLAETLSREHMARASVIMGTTVAIGTFFVYGTSALFTLLTDFKWSFYTAAIVLLAIALIWILSSSAITRRAKCEPEEISDAPSADTVPEVTTRGKKLLHLMIVMLAFYGVATNLIKDGLTTWVPSILKETYALDDSLSIILTLALPILSIFGNSMAIALHKKIPNFVYHTVYMFIASGVIIGGVIAGLSLEQFLPTLIGFAVVCLLVSSCNSLITSIFPLFMKGKVNSGLIAGILNGCCYAGSTISSYGLGHIADTLGWSAVFWLLLGVCAVVALSAGVYALLSRRIKKTHTL